MTGRAGATGVGSVAMGAAVSAEGERPRPLKLAGPTREDVTFESQGVPCAAWLYRPEGDGDAPCVILAHGIDGLREQRLDAFGRRFAEHGIAAFVFDYRSFGASGGEPRQCANTRAQRADWKAALAHVRDLPGVDGERIALWGTSTASGHVLKVAADDGAIAALVMQMPVIDGFAQLRATPIGQSVRLLFAGLCDQARAWLRRPRRPIPFVGQPYALAIVTADEALSGLARITPRDCAWENAVLPAFTLTTALDRPVKVADRVGCPIMICLGDADLIVPPEPSVRLAKRLGDQVTLRRYPYSHFAMYDGAGFEQVAPDQAAFLGRHLLERVRSA
jgi:uncharacterized protein